MGLLNWLLGRTPALTDPPPMIVMTISARAHHADRIDIRAELAQPEQEPEAPPEGAGITRYILEPYFSMIEYTDAQGRFSRRRVTMRHVDDSDGTRYLCAFCHERNALRTFRLDRISCLISQDGEVEDAAPWFADILEISDRKTIARPAPAIPMPRRTPPAGDTRPAALPTGPAVSPYTALRREITPALTLLIAAARSDDFLHPREVDRILRYAEDEAVILRDAGRLPGNPEADAYDKLERTIRRLRPTRDDLTGAFETLSALDLPRQRHLAHALAETAAADGHVDETEADLIEEMRATGTRRHGFGWDG